MRRRRIPLLGIAILIALSTFSVRLAAGRTLAQVQQMIREQNLPWQAGPTSLSELVGNSNAPRPGESSRE